MTERRLQFNPDPLTGSGSSASATWRHNGRMSDNVCPVPQPGKPEQQGMSEADAERLADAINARAPSLAALVSPPTRPGEGWRVTTEHAVYAELPEGWARGTVGG